MPGCWQTILSTSDRSVLSGVGGTANSVPQVDTGGNCSTSKSLDLPSTEVRLLPRQQNKRRRCKNFSTVHVSCEALYQENIKMFTILHVKHYKQTTHEVLLLLDESNHLNTHSRVSCYYFLVTIDECDFFMSNHKGKLAV